MQSAFGIRDHQRREWVECIDTPAFAQGGPIDQEGRPELEMKVAWHVGAIGVPGPSDRAQDLATLHVVTRCHPDVTGMDVQRRIAVRARVVTDEGDRLSVTIRLPRTPSRTRPRGVETRRG